MSDPADMPEPSADMLAAEYALGVLDAPERALAAARIAADPEFAAEVAAWEARLAPLAAEVSKADPPQTLWPRIAARLGGRPGLWNDVGFWRAATAAGVAAAALILIVGPTPRTPPPVPPSVTPAPARTLVAKLAPAPDRPPVLVAALDPNSGELILTPVALAIPADRSAELWVIPQGQKAISLGVIDPKEPTRIPAPAYLNAANRPGTVLAITVEQPGGSPTGQAQGPIVGVGGFAEI